MHVSSSIGIKRNVVNEDSSILWHHRLGLISIEKVKRLVKDGALSTLDFIDFDTCSDCIKEKQTNKIKKERCQKEFHHIRNHTYRYL